MNATIHTTPPIANGHSSQSTIERQRIESVGTSGRANCGRLANGELRQIGSGKLPPWNPSRDPFSHIIL
jgi:hypothetical protein